MKKKAIIYATGERGVYIGRLETCFTRTNVPSTLLVSLEDDLEMIDPMRNTRTKAKSFLIPAGMNLQVNTHGANIAMFFLNGPLPVPVRAATGQGSYAQKPDRPHAWRG